MLSLKIDLVDSIQFNLKAISLRPLQSGLMVLGITIGHASFICMVTIGEASRNFLRNELESLSPHRIAVTPTHPKNQALSSQMAPLTLDDVEEILAGAPAVARAAPQIRMDMQLSTMAASLRGSAVGTSHDHLAVHSLSISAGRFFSADEVTRSARVAVITDKLISQMGLDQVDAVDEIRINTIPFKVLGIVSSRGFSDQFAPDDSVYIPVTTMARDFASQDSPHGVLVDYIALSARGATDVARGKYQVENVLDWRHPLRNFTVRTNEPIIRLINRVTGVMTLVLGCTSVITILVGGIGIMNVMLVSVVQRTYEIGICKALGASSRWILAQFLFEAIVLSASGAAIGILLGIGLMSCLSSFTILRAAIPIWSILASLAISGGLGLTFGILPASRAAKLDPIKALREL